MKPKKKTKNYPKQEKETGLNIVLEPLSVYGNALNLDETRRYTYADYLT